jgi:ATP-dependent DNA helicase RecG
VHGIAELLSMPGGRTLGFKRDLSSARGVLKDLIAFANTAGGTLVIGVEDDRRVAGLPDALAAEEQLASLVADSIAPALLPELELATHEGRDVLIARVAHWRGPFYLRVEGLEAGVYVRLGSTSRRAGPEILAELRRSLGDRSFDQDPCDALAPDALDRARIRTAFRPLGVRATPSRLTTLGVLIGHSGTTLVSNGGVLLFGSEAARREHFPDAHVRCARFRGLDRGSEVIDQLDLAELTLLQAAEEVERFIARNSRVAGPVEGLRRRDVAEYSSVMVREVVVNALAHADYSLAGMSTRVAIYSDRLEVENPGLLPFGMTIEQIKAGQSKIRNRVIARVFRSVNMLEGWGRAWERIQSAVREGYPEPDLEEMGLSFRVTLWPHPATREIGPSTARAASSPQERREWIMGELSRRDGLRVPDIVRALGVAHRTAERDVSALVHQGKIRFVGPRRTGRYERLQE